LRLIVVGSGIVGASCAYTASSLGASGRCSGRYPAWTAWSSPPAWAPPGWPWPAGRRAGRPVGTGPAARHRPGPLHPLPAPPAAQ